MKLAKPDGTAIVALFDYATHGTSLGPGTCRSAAMFWGWPLSSWKRTLHGYDRTRVCRRLGQHRPVVQGASFLQHREWPDSRA